MKNISERFISNIHNIFAFMFITDVMISLSVYATNSDFFLYHEGNQIVRLLFINNLWHELWIYLTISLIAIYSIMKFASNNTLKLESKKANKVVAILFLLFFIYYLSASHFGWTYSMIRQGLWL